MTTTLISHSGTDDLSHKVEVFPVLPHIEKTAHVNAADYEDMYARSIRNPDHFWREQARRLDWLQFPTKIKNTSFVGDVSIKWYEDGVLNACYNCVDRHVPEHGHETALIWEGDDPLVDRHITFRQLKTDVCKLANALKSRGVKKGDRVTIYMPMTPEAVYAMLACARIGAIHSVVFGGFSSEALRDRIQDCGSSVVITADEGIRGGKVVPLKANVDLAIAGLMDVSSVLVLKRTGAPVHMKAGRDVYFDDVVDTQSDDCPVEPMNAEDPLFILYTSGSTGKPKGVLHTTGGYLVYAAMTHEITFDARPGDVYWCTADVGWITGHSYIVYGPLANRVTSVIFEGVPTYPDASRMWQVVDKHKVNLFYTAPTAIRSLIKAGDQFVKATRRDSLRVLGSVGEPINHEAWMWYHNVVGNGQCPIVDTWWQTETGGHLITPLPGATPLKPGSASRPFFGIKAAIVNGRGEIQHGEAHGHLVILDSWPGQMRTLWGNHARFIETYFTTFPGMYCTSDGAKRDKDGDYWITGRVDDVVNVSGHRLGTAEIESAIDEAAGVAESAVVGYPHDIKGQGIYAYVILKEGDADKGTIRADIIKAVRRIIGPIATPDVIQFVPGLPKTRSGKIMRRILRKIASLEIDHLGDTSTLADPDIVPELVKGRKEITL